ncbi:MAG: DNA polymerase III subunit delta [Candidatus Parcubacteria bacterium]|nr:DNA polymerase III subunit delta [Candidatus Parcubacteria bacterium]
MIIFLYGEDTYRSSQKLNQIRDKFLKEVDSSGMNLTTLDGAKLKFEEFNRQVKASPFLARKRMVIIKNLISENKSKEIQKEVVDLLNTESKSPQDDNILVFWEAADHSKSKSKNALWDRLVKEKFAEQFQPLKPILLNSWVEKEITKLNAKIEKSAIPLLAALVGNDLWQLSGEIDKLTNFCQERPITATDIENLVKAKFDDNIFNLVDALGNNNKKLALKLMSDQFYLESDEMYLLAMLVRQFRILLLTKELSEKNPHLGKEKVAHDLNIHPFVAQKAIWQINNFTLDKLKQIYRQLLDIDFKIKTNSLKPRILFDLLIAQI